MFNLPLAAPPLSTAAAEGETYGMPLIAKRLAEVMDDVRGKRRVLLSFLGGIRSAGGHLRNCNELVLLLFLCGFCVGLTHDAAWVDGSPCRLRPMRDGPG